MTDAATVNRDGNIVEDDCPLCLEPLPPFWDVNGRASLTCCGKEICDNCYDTQEDYLRRAGAQESFKEEEERLEQLANYCPLCRAEKPKTGQCGTTTLGQYERGQLALRFYRDVGLYLIHGVEGVEMNQERGLEILKLGAEKGDPNCQYIFGDVYKEGTDGMPEDVARIVARVLDVKDSGPATEAKRWFLAATEQGHAIAEFELALMLRHEGDDSEYLRYLRGSASKGYDRACYNLGLHYCEGSYGLRRSTEDAIHVVTPAAERGHAESMSLLGEILCEPYPPLPPPMNPNFTKGMHWLRRAVEAGDEASICKLKILETWFVSNKCFRCNKDAPPDKTFLRCSRCRTAWYCSKDCQVQHWKAKEGGHKQYCIKWK